MHGPWVHIHVIFRPAQQYPVFTSTQIQNVYTEDSHSKERNVHRVGIYKLSHTASPQIKDDSL